jgi:mannitol/fructose-specific phosphotransferase system IIA component (Ntr-type)
MSDAARTDLLRVTGSGEADVVVANLEAATMSEAIRELMAGFCGHEAVTNPLAWEADLIRREKLDSTATPQGVAFPHARTEAVREIVWAVGTSRAGIEWSAGRQAVRLVILIGVPAGMVREYLEFLGRVNRTLRAEGAVDALAASTSDEELRARLRARFG